MAGVTLRAGAAAGLVGVPLHELRDQVVALRELWPDGAEALQEAAVAAVAAGPVLDVLRTALEARLAAVERWPHPVAARAAAGLRATPHTVATVPGIAGSFGLSARRFEQVFRAEVGIAPKAYRRLHRFRRALLDADRATDCGWSRFAAEHGYADQSHLIGDFRAHCAMTPTAYLEARGPAINHVPLGA
jgi:transcriptional regulator GlxA family with amidase domain